MASGTETDQPSRPTIVDRVRAHPVLAAAVAAAVVGGIVFVLWWFQPQALLFDRVVDEEFPTTEAPIDDADAVEDDQDERSEASGAAEDDATDADDAGASDADPTDDDAGEADAAGEADGAADEDADADVSDEEATPDEPVALSRGEFVSRNRYTVVGEATAYELPDGGRLLRLEDFESTNGPDLYVYLVAADRDDSDEAYTDDAVDLGALTGNIGNQNYDIPDDVDLDHYDTVVIWCERFTTSFGAANLMAP